MGNMRVKNPTRTDTGGHISEADLFHRPILDAPKGD